MLAIGVERFTQIAEFSIMRLDCRGGKEGFEGETRHRTPAKSR